MAAVLCELGIGEEERAKIVGETRNTGLGRMKDGYEHYLE